MSETQERPALQTPFAALGGEAGVRRLVDAFYDAMERDPAAAPLRAIHAADLTPMRERLADWLSGWLGGPPVYFERHPGRPCVMSAHAPFAIGAAEVEQWLGCMRQALEAVRAPEAWREPLMTAFTRMCGGMRNR